MKFPRPYISFSQIASYENNSFYNNYVLERKTFANKYITFGKHFANAMEGKFAPPDIQRLADGFRLTLSDGIVEYKGEAVYKYKGNEYNLLGYIDYLSENVDEFKTGKVPWTQRKANTHGQVLFYQLIMWLSQKKKYGGYYHWIQTKEVEGQIEGTGVFKKFPVPYDIEKISNIEKRLQNYIDFVENYEPPKTLKL